MATAGTLVYSTRLDTSGMDKGLKGMTGKVQGTGSTIKSILGGLGIAALVSKGISAISSSMDGAIKRLDTMNNFPKVMSNLGINADKSKASIDKLSKGLQNVPTTLDEAALSVQRFTSSNSDVEKSTDIFLAVNDAILAGGASAQIQSSALEQLTQAYGRGKPDINEWKTMQMAMPAQLKQVAIAMGYAGGNVSALGEDLRSGKVSMDDFINTIVQLDKEGVKGFPSIKEQAENAVGGIGTAIANMKTAITRGVATALDSLDKSLKDSGLGGLSGVISNIGKAVESMLKKITPLISSTIKTLATIFSWMKKHEELVKVLAVVIGSFIGTFMLIQKVIAIINAVKTAFAVLNAVMMANPIGLIIAAVAALVAVFVYLWKHCEGFRNFWIGLWDGIKNIVVGTWNFLKGIFTSVINFVKNNWKTILLFLVNPFAGAFKYLYEHSEKFRNFVDKFIKKVVEIVKAIPSFIASLPGKIISFLQQIPAYLGYLIGWIIGKYVAFWQMIWNFVTKTIPELITKVIEWIKELPGKIWETLKMIVAKVIIWGIQMVTKAKETGKNFANNVINFFKSLPSKIWTWLLNTLARIGQWAINMKNKGIAAARNLVNAIVNGVKSLPSKMANIGKNIVQGIWNGIKNAKDWIIGKIKEFAGGVVKGFKKALGIKSPSKVLRDEVGKWIPEGIAVGIDANTDSVMKALDDMDKEMVSRLQNAINNETGRLTANANIKGNSFLNTTTVNSHVVADVYMDRTKVGQAVTPVVAQTIRKAGA